MDSMSEMEPLQYSSEENSEETDESTANLRMGNLLFEELFESGTAFSKQSHQFAGTHSFGIETDPQNKNNKVGKFELRQNDNIVKSSKRAEIGFRETLKEGWYAYSIFFPTTNYAKDSAPEILSQWHQSGGGSPPNALQVENDEIYFRSINRSDTDDNSNKVYSNYPLGKVQRGTWTHFVFHIVHSPNSDGLIEIWQNNKKVHTIKGPNMRRKYELPGFKLGIYKWTWAKQKTNTDRRVVYFDDVKMSEAGASINDFLSEKLPTSDKPAGVVTNEPAKEQKSDLTTEVIKGFTLVQANTDVDVVAISNGGTITVDTHKLNIRANTTSSFSGEIRYTLSGASGHKYTDATAPYTLFGDDGKGNYYFGSGLYPGTYVLEAVPYKDGKVAGNSKKIQFTLKK